MNADNDQKLEPDSSPYLGDVIDAVDRKIHDYLLRQHLSLRHPISTAPDNHDLELTVLDGASSVVSPFPCRRVNTGQWVNTDLRTSLHIQPIMASVAESKGAETTARLQRRFSSRQAK
jgi:hypothetical protein